MELTSSTQLCHERVLRRRSFQVNIQWLITPQWDSYLSLINFVFVKLISWALFANGQLSSVGKTLFLTSAMQPFGRRYPTAIWHYACINLKDELTSSHKLNRHLNQKNSILRGRENERYRTLGIVIISANHFTDEVIIWFKLKYRSIFYCWKGAIESLRNNTAVEDQTRDLPGEEVKNERIE